MVIIILIFTILLYSYHLNGTLERIRLLECVSGRLDIQIININDRDVVTQLFSSFHEFNAGNEYFLVGFIKVIESGNRATKARNLIVRQAIYQSETVSISFWIICALKYFCHRR